MPRLLLTAILFTLLLSLPARAQTAPATEPAQGLAVTAWVEIHTISKNLSKEISPDNPEDPQRSYTITIFSLSNHDGQLEFKEFPKRNDGSKAEINFHHAYKEEKDAFQIFPPMMRTIIDDKDPTRRAIAMATACFLYQNQNPKLFNRLALSPDNIKTASEAFKKLRDNLALVDADTAAGKIEPAQYAKLLAALETFRAPGNIDFQANPTQAADAKKVIELGLPFAQIIQDRKLKLINDYADSMIPLLSDDQKKTAVKIGEDVLTTYWNTQHANATRRRIIL